MRRRATQNNSGRGGARTLTGVTPHGILSHDATPENPEENGRFENRDAAGAAVDSENVQIDPDLQAIVERWADLPDAVKAGIVAMVQTATKSA